jgi:LmbE family N-acetylglucosaminyl deacetylase
MLNEIRHKTTASVATLLLLGAVTTADAATLLAVFAHPDDEISVGPLLARYAAEGHDVYLVTATSGQVGGSNTDIPEGDELGAAREAEARCSAAALGIHEPHLLAFMDGAIADRAVALPGIREKLREIFREVRPDVVVTWGPDGLSGHQDHRLIHTLASEVFQEPWEGPGAPRKLYYVALPESRARKVPDSERGQRGALVRDELITTVVDGRKYLEPTLAAMKCHVTQWAPEERMQAMFDDRTRLLEGQVHLRLAISTLPPAAGIERSVFDRLPPRPR